MMHAENGDGILVQGSDSKALREAIVEHSELAGYEEPITLRVSIVRIDAERYGVRFDPKTPLLSLRRGNDSPQLLVGVIL